MKFEVVGEGEVLGVRFCIVHATDQAPRVDA